MYELRPDQRSALQMLAAAFHAATESGLFDQLQPECRSPDSINDVADAIASRAGETRSQPQRPILRAAALYEMITAAAAAHGEDSEPEFELGDLQAALDAALEHLTSPQLQAVHDHLRSNVLGEYWPSDRGLRLCGSQGVSEDGRCLRCGLEPDGEAGCPPGFFGATSTPTEST